MHCPNCGDETLADRKFCRRCGFALEAVSQLVSAHHDKVAEGADKGVNHEQMRGEWMGCGVLLLLIGVVVFVVGSRFGLGHVVSWIAILVMLVGGLSAVYGLMSSMLSRANEQKRLMEPGASTKELEGRPDSLSIPSVTERTTQLIAEQRRYEPEEK